MRTPSRKLIRADKSRCGLVAAVLLLVAATAWAQEESLGEYARRIQSQKQSQVLISSEDGQRLFKQVDEITQFSSQDSGLPKLAPVKRQLIGRAEAEKHFRRESEDETQHQRRLDQTTVVLQKFGMLPANFEINAALGNLVLNGIAGFYDYTDKTMYLLNWIDPELQKMVMAHELTHALQDQNFQLSRFQSRPQPAAGHAADEDGAGRLLGGSPCAPRRGGRAGDDGGSGLPAQIHGDQPRRIARCPPGGGKYACRPATTRRSPFTTLRACCAKP